MRCRRLPVEGARRNHHLQGATAAVNPTAVSDAASRRARPRTVALDVRERLIGRVQQWVDRRLDKRVHRAVARELDRRLDRAVALQVERRLERAVAQQLDKRLDRAVARELDKRLDRAVAQEVDKRLDRAVAQQVDKRLDRVVAQHLGERLDRAVVQRVDDRLHELQQVGALDGWRLKASPKAVRAAQGLVMHVIDLCELQRDDAVLEIGCGGGGPALHLTGYLSEEGRYEGLDIMSEKIEKCQRVISARHPNFHFQVADVYNRNYNPDGKYKASEYRFPFDDESFDVAFLGSVFTHMLPPDVENYLCQISRVLKKGGRCLITYFLINDESQERIEAGLTGKTFAHHYENYRAEDPNVHERAVGLPEDFVRALYEKCGLRIMEPIRYGYWCGRQQFLSKQDIIVAMKT
jgi:ubiquinone/menaquinone biosynthesis C-methylase UbiE